MELSGAFCGGDAMQKMHCFPNELCCISGIYGVGRVCGVREVDDAWAEAGIGCGDRVEMEKSVAGHRYRLLFST